MKWITEAIEENENKKHKEFLKNFKNYTMSAEVKPFSNQIPGLETPRRIRLDLLTPGEKAIYDAIQEVEAAGCDVRLTDAINLLTQARNKVADYVDGIEVVPGKNLSELTEEDAAEIWIAFGGTPHLFDFGMVKEWLICGDCEGMHLDAFTMNVVLKRLAELGYDVDLDPGKTD